DAKALRERVLRVLFDEFEEGVFLAALRIEDFDAMAGGLRQHIFEKGAIFEIHRRVNVAREIGGVEIKLLEQRGEKFGGIECIELLPVKIATVDDAAAAQMEEIGGDLGRFGVPGEHVGIVS